MPILTEWFRIKSFICCSGCQIGQRDFPKTMLLLEGNCESLLHIPVEIRQIASDIPDGSSRRSLEAFSRDQRPVHGSASLGRFDFRSFAAERRSGERTSYCRRKCGRDHHFADRVHNLDPL